MASFSHGIDILEQRIAPATLVVSPDFTVHFGNGDAVPAGMIIPAADALLALRLGPGDHLFFDADASGTKTPGDLRLLDLTTGRAIAVFVDTSADLVFTPDEFTEVAVTNGFSGALPRGLNGSLTTSIDKTGAWTRGIVGPGDILSITASGPISGDVRAGGSISQVSITQAGQDHGAAVRSIIAGGAVKNIFLDGGAESVVSGGEIRGLTAVDVATAIAITSVKTGKSIINTRLELIANVDVTVSGGYKDSAGAGGDVTGLRILAPLGLGKLVIQGGNAGTSEAGVGGKGGSVKGSSVEFTGDFVSIDVFGGTTVGDTTRGGGSISGFRLVGKAITNSGVATFSGGESRGIGAGGGISGAVVTLGANEPDTYFESLNILGGLGPIGGSVRDVTLTSSVTTTVQAGNGERAGGSIESLTLNSLIGGSFSVQAGNAGVSGDGGSIIGVVGTFAGGGETYLTLQAGNGGAAEELTPKRLGNGGEVRGVSITATGAGAQYLSVAAGSVGTTLAEELPKGAKHGGDVSDIQIKSDGDVGLSVSSGTGRGFGSDGGIDNIIVRAGFGVGCGFTGGATSEGGSIGEVSGLGDISRIRIHAAGQTGGFDFAGRSIRDVVAKTGAFIGSLTLFATNIENVSLLSATDPAVSAAPGVTVEATTIRNFSLTLGKFDDSVNVRADAITNLAIDVASTPFIAVEGYQKVHGLSIATQSAPGGISVSGFAPSSGKSDTIQAVALQLGAGEFGPISFGAAAGISDVSITRSAAYAFGFPSVSIDANNTPALSPGGSIRNIHITSVLPLGDNGSEPSGAIEIRAGDGGEGQPGGNIKDVSVNIAGTLNFITLTAGNGGADGDAPSGGSIQTIAIGGYRGIPLTTQNGIAIQAGNAGTIIGRENVAASAHGGSVANISIAVPSAAVEITAGNGDTDIVGRRGTNGGSVRSISGQVDTLTIRAGFGGGNTIGGSGGSIFEVTVRASVASLFAGYGGEGVRRGGGGGSITDIAIIAGNSEFYGGTGGGGAQRGGDGGSILRITTTGEIDAIEPGPGGASDEEANKGQPGEAHAIRSPNTNIA